MKRRLILPFPSHQYCVLATSPSRRSAVIMSTHRFWWAADRRAFNLYVSGGEEGIEYKVRSIDFLKVLK